LSTPPVGAIYMRNTARICSTAPCYTGRIVNSLTAPQGLVSLPGFQPPLIFTASNPFLPSRFHSLSSPRKSSTSARSRFLPEAFLFLIKSFSEITDISTPSTVITLSLLIPSLFSKVRADLVV